jgi:aryl-alcohol dehydrogenase-like predicted oxidoreductase
LGTDWIDLLSAHRFDPDTPLEETVGAFGSLAMAGTVAHWGVSEWTATQLAQAVSVADDLGVPRPVANQCQHSVLWRVPEIEVAPVCAKYGIGEVSFWSLAQGVLTGKYPPHAAAPAHSRGASEFGRATMSHVMHDEVLARVELFAELARRRGVSAAQLALAWVLSRPVVSSTVVGVSSVEQLVDNAAASGASFSDKTWLLIDKLFDGCIHEDPAATG